MQPLWTIVYKLKSSCTYGVWIITTTNRTRLDILECPNPLLIRMLMMALECPFGHHFHIRSNSFFRQPSLFLEIINKRQVSRAFVSHYFFLNKFNHKMHLIAILSRWSCHEWYRLSIRYMGWWFYLEDLCCTDNKSMAINLFRQKTCMSCQSQLKSLSSFSLWHFQFLPPPAFCICIKQKTINCE